MVVLEAQVPRRAFLLALPVSIAVARNLDPPAPYGALPSASQLAWSELEFYNFLHFTVNTFTDREWGNGDEDPTVFNPTDFDPDAICDALKNAGSAGLILTAKHHDGFCLWPTKTTKHSVARSPYKNGKGDIVAELSQAARRHDLKFGVYCSPWDRNQASYGTPRYLQIYREQLSELLTNYGPIFEIWHDGANGGSGYYGGARETRIIDKLHYYDWPTTWALEHRLQPAAVRFSDVGPDVRWVGNEKGIAGETCWETYTPHSPNGGPGSPGDIVEAESTTGTRNGKYWMPAECDVSIRPGWFWHARENDKVKTGRELLSLYYDSAGRGASFLLNVPPDRRGRIYEADARALQEFANLRRATFAVNLAERAAVRASNVRRNSPAYQANHLVDGERSTYWATDDAVTTPEATFVLSEPATFDVVRLREHVALGQRIEQAAIDTWREGRWQEVVRTTSIGSCRILRLPKPVTSTRVRLRILRSPVCIALSEFGLYRQV